MATLSVGACVRFGWETFKRRPLILIAAFIIVYAEPSLVGAVVASVLEGILDAVGVPPWNQGPVMILALLAAVAAWALALLGAFTLYLRAHDNIDGVTFADIWNPGPFWRFLGAEVLLIVLLVVGSLLFVLPGIIAAVGFGFAPLLTIDRGLGPIEALKTSWRITGGYKGTLFLLLLALTGLNLLGGLALGIGLVVSIPVGLLALVHAYRTLTPRA